VTGFLMVRIMLLRPMPFVFTYYIPQFWLGVNIAAKW
jgi:hypothetical protein